MSKTLLRALPLATLCAALGCAGPASASGWNEAVDGDLSNDNLVPTSVTLSLGSTLLSGTTGRAVAGGPIDRDYFTVVVPAGQVLESMILQEGVTVVGGGSFLGVMAGAPFTVPPTTSSAAGLLGWTIFTQDNVGSDMLWAMSFPAFESSGFTVPLPAGTYSFWIQEASVGTASYSFQFNVSAVPEIPPALGLGAGIALWAALRRRRR